MNLDRELAFFWDSNVERFDNRCKIAIEHYTKLENWKQQPEIQNLFMKYYSKWKDYSERIKDALQVVSNLKLKISNGITEDVEQVSNIRGMIEHSVKELDIIVQQIWQIILGKNHKEIGLLDNVKEELLTDATTIKLENLWKSHNTIMIAHYKQVEKAAYETCTQIELSQFKTLGKTYDKMKEHYDSDIKRKISWKRMTAIKQVETGVRELCDVLDNMSKTAHIEYTKPWIYLDKRNVIEEDPNPFQKRLNEEVCKSEEKPKLQKKIDKETQDLIIELDVIWKSNKNRIEEGYKMAKENYVKKEVSALGEEDKNKFVQAESQYLHCLKSADTHIQSNSRKWSKHKALKEYVTETITELDGYVATMSELIKIETFQTFDDSETAEEYKNVLNDWGTELKRINEKYQKITKYFYDETRRDLEKWGHKLDVDVLAEIGKVEHKFNIYLLHYKKNIGKPITKPSTKDVRELKKEMFESQKKLQEYIQTLIKEYADVKKIFFR